MWVLQVMGREAPEEGLWVWPVWVGPKRGSGRGLEGGGSGGGKAWGLRGSPEESGKATHGVRANGRLGVGPAGGSLCASAGEARQDGL